MAIPKFFGKWLTKKGYLNIFIDGYVGEISSLSIDLNALIHDAAGETWMYKEPPGVTFSQDHWKRVQEALSAFDQATLERNFWITLENKLDRIIRAVRPMDSLIIAVDGLAPVGKIQQQRDRRYKSGATRRNYPFDSNCITPGTDFMMRLDAELTRYFISEEFRSIFPRGAFPPNFIYSSHLDPGEGEHKIMEFFRQGLVPAVSEDAKHVFHGLDADLFLLTMLLPIKGALIYREDLGQGDYIRYVNIDALKEGIQGELQTETAIQDFVLLTYLAGNDFLPHQSALDDIAPALNSLMAIYSELKLNLTTKYEEDYPEEEKLVYWNIEWVNLSYFIDEVAVKEPEYLAHRASRERGRKADAKFNPSVLLETTTVELPTYYEFSFLDYRKRWYNMALGPKDAALAALFPDLLSPSIDKIVEMTLSYLSVFSWCLEYYTRGTWAVNFDLYYPYRYAPLLADVSAVLRADNIQDLLLPVLSASGGKPTGNLTPLHQLIAVMPKSSFSLLPPLGRELLSASGPLGDLAPMGFTLELEGVERESNGVVSIPFADMSRIDEAIKLYIPDKDLLRYAEKVPQSFSSGANITPIIRTRDITEKAPIGNKPRGRNRPRLSMQQSSELIQREVRSKRMWRDMERNIPLKEKSRPFSGPRPFQGGRGGFVHQANQPSRFHTTSANERKQIPPNVKTMWSQSKPLM